MSEARWLVTAKDPKDAATAEKAQAIVNYLDWNGDITRHWREAMSAAFASQAVSLDGKTRLYRTAIEALNDETPP